MRESLSYRAGGLLLMTAMGLRAVAISAAPWIELKVSCAVWLLRGSRRPRHGLTIKAGPVPTGARFVFGPFEQAREPVALANLLS